MKFTAIIAATAALIGSTSASDQIFFDLSKQEVMYHPDMVTLNGAQCRTDVQLIQMSEGYRACMYLDSVGVPTVCWGYNLHNYNARSEVSNAGSNLDKLLKGGCTTKPVCDALLNLYVSRSHGYAHNVFGNSLNKCKYAWAVATDMTYNMGEIGMKNFNWSFDNAMKNGQWSNAVNILKGT